MPNVSSCNVCDVALVMTHNEEPHCSQPNQLAPQRKTPIEKCVHSSKSTVENSLDRAGSRRGLWGCAFVNQFDSVMGLVQVAKTQLDRR